MSEILIAKIERFVYRNDENSYSIARVIDQKDIQQTIVGYLPLLSEDVYYEFTGSWVFHDTFGRQFSVQSYKQSKEQSIDGLTSYLSSSFFTGIGPVTANRIVEKLGMDAINVILEDKSVLAEFGFTKVRIEKFYQQLVENQKNEHILVVLYGYNIGGKTAMKILNTYGILTIDKLEENPYQLIKDIGGIGFIKADEIAKKMGIKENDERRVEAAVLFAMNNYAFQNGDIYLNAKDLESYVYKELRFDIELQPYLDILIAKNEIIKEEDRYYLFNTYETENIVANEIKRLITDYELPLNNDHLESLLDMVEIQKNIQYTDMQKKAILTSLNSKFSIITGGPGTGKTTIIDGLLSVYANYNNLKLESEGISEKIALMAPTGRAAKRMEEVLNLKATTIHRALGYGYDGMFNFDKNNKLKQKLIIIDESSMIDIFLAKRLFESIDSDAKVIIVGDVDQLPSVSPGSVLKDIIESNKVSVVKLNEIHRQAIDSNIIKLAIKVNEQRLSIYDLDSGNDLFLRNARNDEIKNIIMSQVQGALNKGYSMVEDIQVLIPTYKGDIGIDAVNLLMQQTFNDINKPHIKYGDKVYYKDDKVIQLVNDPKNFIMNGDIGYIKKIGINSQNKEFITVSYDSNDVMYEKNDLDQISLAYAMSIHKSQGSEYKIVILPLVKAFTHMLKKELLYTAITRAKDFLIVLGDMDLLVYAANNLSEKRKTTLKMRLINDEVIIPKAKKMTIPKPNDYNKEESNEEDLSWLDDFEVIDF